MIAERLAATARPSTTAGRVRGSVAVARDVLTRDSRRGDRHARVHHPGDRPPGDTGGRSANVVWKPGGTTVRGMPGTQDDKEAQTWRWARSTS